MQTRGQFDQELKAIDNAIVEVANLAEKALKNAVESLFNQDIQLAEQVIEADKDIDKKELEINDKIVLLIAKQNPVATDLRRLITALQIVADLERMADNARNIARSTIRLGESEETLIPKRLHTMKDALIHMLHTAITAFTEEDSKLASQLAEMDDFVDKENKLILSELLGETATNPDKIQYIMQISLCSRYLERFGDHITNIGESILYLIKGENYNLN
jgi:phosphate transport system protein